MKKCTAVLLCMVLVLSLFCVNAAAAQNPVIEAGATVSEGVVTVELRALQTTANAHLTVDFDPNCLSYTGCETAFTVHTVKSEEGKLTIGPFYTQFDEWIPAGESMVRNCLWGDRMSKFWGGQPLKAGYLPDNFGHPDQLPQIFRNFGIDSLLFTRGMEDAGEFREFVCQFAAGIISARAGESPLIFLRLSTSSAFSIS